MSKTPHIWMEARCGSVTGGGSDNWEMPDYCYQTADGGFFVSVVKARKHFLKCRWSIIDDHWWCPVCTKILKG